jgi:hypothetical protein
LAISWLIPLPVKEVAMISRQMEFESEREMLFVEQAQAMFREMRAAARRAPHGKVLNAIETMAVVEGRELMRHGLESVAQDEIQVLEKKGRRSGPAVAADRGTIAARHCGKSSRRPVR